MNDIEARVNKQYSAVSQIEYVKCNLRRAIQIVNADYQNFDWDDQEFLNRVLYDAISALEPKEV